MKRFVRYPGFLGLPPQVSDYEGAKWAILPVPYEGTVSFGTGTAHGPNAIIESSQFVETWDQRFGLDLEELRLATLAELSVVEREPRAVVDLVDEVVGSLLDDGKRVVVIGGEHSISTGAIRAVLRRNPDMGVLHVDAHADLREEYEGTPWSHAAVMRRVRELTKNTVSVGIRSLSKEEQSFIEADSVPIVWGWELHGEWLEKVLENLPPLVWLSFDIDAFDPAVAPATGTPEPGGMSWDQALTLIEALVARHTLVGVDLVEVAPMQGSSITEFLAARFLATLLGLVDRRERCAILEQSP